MGCCLSKTNPSHPPLSNVEAETPQPDAKSKIPPTQLEEISKKSDIAETEKKEEPQILEQEEKKESLGAKDKEEFVIQPRKSHDKRSDSKGLRSDSSDPDSNNQKSLASNIMAMAASGGVVRTSSCTKEEVDAILIQCGRLSRSSSGKCASSGSNRKYSGSKRNHDFDKDNNNNRVPIELNCDENEDDERQRRRQSRESHRRTTSSRSRERDPQAQKSTGSGGGRRLSRSPAKRSETSNNTTTTTSSNNRPGKLVSVPATVSSLSMEKSNNGEGANTTTNTGIVKRVLVRRNVTPPRSRSPARSALVGSSSNGVKNANNQNQPSPSRNLSRKAEHSPYRRTPLTDLDMNSLPFQPLGNKSSSIKGNQKIRELNGEVSAKQQPLTSASQNKLGVVQGTHRRARSRGGEGSDLANETICGSNTLTRTRSSRRSRDLDVESLSNPDPVTNYTSLLLQDIQNFHQKASTTSTNTTSAPDFKLPECVSKACSIVEAVADLNLNSCSTRTIGRVNGGDDDLMTEPRLQKFVTVEKKREIDEKEESSGSNSVVGNGGQNQWVSSSASSWELRSEGVSPASFQRLATVSSNSRNGVARSRAGSER